MVAAISVDRVRDRPRPRFVLAQTGDEALEKLGEDPIKIRVGALAGKRLILQRQQRTNRLRTAWQAVRQRHNVSAQIPRPVAVIAVNRDQARRPPFMEARPANAEEAQSLFRGDGDRRFEGRFHARNPVQRRNPP